MKFVTMQAAKASRPAQKACAGSSVEPSVAASGMPGKYIRPRLLLPPSCVRILNTAELNEGNAVAAPPPVVVPLGTDVSSGPRVGETRFQTTFSKFQALVTTGKM